MAGDEERDGRSEWAGPSDAPFETVIERVDSDQTVRVSEYDGDEEDSPMHPDSTTYGEQYGITGRPPKDTECLAVNTEYQDWVVSCNVDRPSVAAEGNVIVYEMYESGGSWVVGSKIEMAQDITITPRGKVVTEDTTYIGSASAAKALLIGTDFVTNFKTMLTSWSAALQALISSPPADPFVTTYANALKPLVDALNTLAATWESAKHRIDQ